MSALLEVDHLTMTFGGLIAVSNFDLAVETGQIHALIGPNGAGKTTMLNMICGLYHPTSGHIRFKGKPITGLAPHRVTQCGIARTFQHIQIFEALNVLENVMVARHVRSSANLFSSLLNTSSACKEERSMMDKAIEVLDFVGITEGIETDAATLNCHEKRLIEIARALATEPQLILLDEPFAGMNETENRVLTEILRKIIDQGITVILVEHNMNMVMTLSDRISVMDFGVKIAEGIPDEIQIDPKVIEAYLGIDNTHATAA